MKTSVYLLLAGVASGCVPAASDVSQNLCGNGVVDAQETCDGNCPTTCDDAFVCTQDALTGTAADCTAHCTYIDITQCTDADGCCASGCDATSDSDCLFREEQVEPNLKVAFFGDQGLSENAQQVLSLVVAEGAQALVILGDFSYMDDPAVSQDGPDTWDAFLSANLPADFPVFGVMGNHDVAFGVWDGYQAKLEARLGQIAGAMCTGELAVKAACTYKGLFFILSAVGNNYGTDHEAFIEEQLSNSRSIWRVCAWHRNQYDMQVGDKPDEIGWRAYRACQNGAAVIATGHEHSYSRTKTLTRLGDRQIGHGTTGEPASVTVKQGSTFVFVSGLGGQSGRKFGPEHESDTWWATYYTSDRYRRNGVDIQDYNYTFGAMFITFGVDNDPYLARGYFKTIDGVVIDEFEISAR